MRNNKAIQKLTAIILSIIMAVGMTPVSAASDMMEVTYVDENGVLQTVSASVIKNETTELTNEWYVVVGNVNTTSLNIVNHNVKIILTDGCKLTVNGTDHNAAVRVVSGNSLTVYSQTLGTGMLTATSAGRGAGIGGNGGGDGLYSSANGESSGTVTINGGTVTTNRIGGGNGSGCVWLSGDVFSSAYDGGHGGTVTINGGTAIVSDRIGGGDGGDGNYGGASGGDGGNGSGLTIRGGNISIAGKIGGGAAGSGFLKPFVGPAVSGTAGGAGSCTITGGSVQVSTMQPTPKDDGGSTVSLTTVTLSGASTLRTVQAIVTSLPSTFGTRDMKTDTSGKLYLWLPSGSSVTDAFSQGSRYTGLIPAGTSGTLVVSGAIPDTPVITSIVPVNGELEVPVNGSISVTFNGVMNAWSGSVTLRADDLDTIVLTRGIWTNSGIYTVSYSGLSYSTEYTVTLSGFQDAYGQNVDSVSLVFTTAIPPKSVTVGAQSGTLVCGTVGNVAFPITVVSIADGTYSVTLDGAPDGVTTGDITIASGSGTLTVNTSADTPEGSYTMTATIDGIVSDSFILTVSDSLPTVDSVSVSPTTVEVQKGTTQVFTAIVTGKNHPLQTVTWEIIGNNSTITNIDASGLLTVSADETAASLIVKATSTVDTGISGTATVTVTEIPAPPIYQISLGSIDYAFPDAVEGYEELPPLAVQVINTGNQPTGDLTVALGGSNYGDFILFKTTIDSIAVSGSDYFSVTPMNNLAAGIYTATVTVTGENGINKSINISFTVNSTSSIPVSGVSLNKSTLNLTAGVNSTIIATVEPANASNKRVSWSSSDSSVAMVDNNGAIAANSVGTAIITVITEDGNFSATCTVNVSEAAPVTTYTVTFDLNGGTRTGGGQLIQTVVHGGSATAPTVSRSSYTFTGWDKAFTNVTSNLTVTANWRYDGGGSGGSDSRDDTTDDIIQTDKEPDQPVVASFSATPAVTVSQNSVTDAIAKAQADAKKQGKTTNGIGVSLNVDLPDTTKSLVIVLPRAVLNSLVNAGVKQFEINGAIVSLDFDLEALREIRKQSAGDVTITIRTVMDLSGEAKKLIGARPAYDVTVSYVKNGKTISITSLGKGSVILSVPYKLNKNEAVGWLFGVYVDASGKAMRASGSVYDANSESLILSTGHLSLYGVGYIAPAEKYADIASHWAKESIDYVVGRGLFSGTADTKFSPDMAMGRGMLVTVLGRLAGADVSACKTSSFSDVAEGKYYQPYVEWAYKKGIVSGIGNGKFAPERAVTREEIALVLRNYAKATGNTLPVTREAGTFADASDIGSLYSDAVKAIQQAGIMVGTSGNRFNPRATATRAEVAAMLHRYVKLTIDPATAQGWAKNDDGQYMYYKDGKPLIGWQTIDGLKYYFYSTGVLQTG